MSGPLPGNFSNALTWMRCRRREDPPREVAVTTSCGEGLKILETFHPDLKAHNQMTINPLWNSWVLLDSNELF